SAVGRLSNDGNYARNSGDYDNSTSGFHKNKVLVTGSRIQVHSTPLFSRLRSLSFEKQRNENDGEAEDEEGLGSKHNLLPWRVLHYSSKKPQSPVSYKQNKMSYGWHKCRDMSG